MYGRSVLDRFKKAESVEPFSVTSKTLTLPHAQSPKSNEEAPLNAPVVQVTLSGGGQSSWQPPDWAIEPRHGVYFLDVLKDGDVLDRISLNRRRHIFGRQSHTCDIVLDHQSISRQHAAVIPHKNGSIFVIDLGSAHGTFVANERLTKDTPVELEVGQSLRFAASTRTYILRKNDAAFYNQPPSSSDIKLRPPPDPSDEEALVAYNTLLNRYGLSKDNVPVKRYSEQPMKSAKRSKKTKVGFLDQVGGNLVEIVGFSDGADVGSEPGPIGVKEGSLVGKYESLVQSVIIPKGKEHAALTEKGEPQRVVSSKLQEVISKVKGPAKVNGLYGELFSGYVGSSWASQADKIPSETAGNCLSLYNDENDDDLFGE